MNTTMNPEVSRKLLQVGEAFRIPGPFFSYDEIKVGNVNHTYKVNYIRDDGTGMARIESYLVQRVNTYVSQRAKIDKTERHADRSKEKPDRIRMRPGRRKITA